MVLEKAIAPHLDTSRCSNAFLPNLSTYRITAKAETKWNELARHRAASELEGRFERRGLGLLVTNSGEAGIFARFRAIS